MPTVEKNSVDQNQELREGSVFENLMVGYIANDIAEAQFYNIIGKDISDLLGETSKKVFEIISSSPGSMDALRFAEIFAQHEIIFLSEYCKEDKPQVSDMFHIKTQLVIDEVLVPSLGQAYFDYQSENFDKEDTVEGKKLCNKFDAFITAAAKQHGLDYDRLRSEAHTKWVEGMFEIDYIHTKAYNSVLLKLKSAYLASLFLLKVWNDNPSQGVEWIVVEKIELIEALEKELINIYQAVSIKKHTDDTERRFNCSNELKNRALILTAPKLYRLISDQRSAWTNTQVLFAQQKAGKTFDMGEPLKRLELLVDINMDMVNEVDTLKNRISKSGNEKFVDGVWKILSGGIFFEKIIDYTEDLEKSYQEAYGKPVFEIEFRRLKDANDELRKLAK